MSKENVCGYITHVSPKRPCKNRQPMFDIKLQNSANTSRAVRGFGETQYDKMRDFYMSKSPVKMQVLHSPGYRVPSFSDRCLAEDATQEDVPFEVNTSATSLDDGERAKPSKEATVATVLKASPDDEEYFSLQGILTVGSESPKTRRDGKKVKDDIWMYDKTGKIQLSMWNDSWNEVKSGSTVLISHVKVRVFNSQKTGTTSPWSKITMLEDDLTIEVPEDMPMSSNLVTTLILHFDDVGLVKKYSECSHCCQKIGDSDVRKIAFSCNTCQKNYHKRELRRVCAVPVSFKEDENIVHLMVPKQVIDDFTGEDLEGDCLADVLLESENVTLTYSKRDKLVTAMKM